MASAPQNAETDAIRALRDVHLAVLKNKNGLSGCCDEDVISWLNDEDWWTRQLTLFAIGLQPRVLTKYVEHIVPMLDDECITVQNEAVRVLGKLKPSVLAQYTKYIIPKLYEFPFFLCDAKKAVVNLDPQALAMFAQNIIPGLDKFYRLDDALETLMALPLVALVPHRYALKSTHTVTNKKLSSLRGGVWLTRWRQLFWCQRLLWYWDSLTWKPGSRRARAAASEFGRMQGVSAEEEGEREVKRARVV